MNRILQALCLSLVLPLAALAAPVRFDIPAGKVTDSLLAFSKQSGVDVLYSFSDLKGATAPAVKGSYEPEAALAALLHGTGFVATRGEAGKFVVSRERRKSTGSVDGALFAPPGSGKTTEGVSVAVLETGDAAAVDRHGRFAFSSLPAGTYTLVATGEGFSRLRIEDVSVSAGHSISLGAQEMPIVRKGGEIQMMAEVVVRADKDIQTMNPYVVSETKPEPYSDMNVDIPRGIDDPQPYYVFNSQTLEQSGSVNVEDFLKTHLTMNSSYRLNSQINAVSTPGGSSLPGSGAFPSNVSSINLSGLGANETLVLVDGRRMAGVNLGGASGYSSAGTGQPDINGIPLASIDRIEVLPSSASGIYGGSAIGGVINIITKKDYRGGELSLTHSGTWDGHAPSTTAGLTYGRAFDKGRTHLSLAAQYETSDPLYVRDRAGYFERYIALHPVTSGGIPLGSTPNILDAAVRVPPPGSTPYPPNSAYYEVPAGTPGASYNSTLGVYYLINPTVDMGNLTFKNGVSLNSLYTYVPPGTSPSTPLSVLEAGLAQNAGHYNLTLPDTNNSNGLRNPLGVSTQVRSISGTLRRQMTGVLELFATLSTASNHSFENTNAFGLGTAQLSPGNPYNPFLNYITIIYPSELSTPAYSNSTTHSFTFGGTLKLPKDWRAEFDYTWSQSLFEEISWSGRGGPNYEIAPSDPQVYDGPLDFMMDTAKYLDLTGYALPIFATGSSTSNDLALRASGPLYHFPWGAPVLSFSLDHNKYGTPVEHNPYVRVNPTFPDGNPVSGFNANGSTTLNNHDAVEFGQSSTDDSAYAELNVPIFKTRYPFLRALNMQVALRFDQTKTGAGTQGYYYNAVNPSLSSYFGTTSDGGTSLTTSSPYRYIITTRSTNFTGPAWEYEPFDTVKIRFSYASAFLPPTPGQLLPSPKTGSYVNTTSNYVADPKHPTAQTGTHTSNGLPAYLVAVYSMGGNPDLSPQSSKSWDVGAIWEPRRGFVKGLRADVEFSETVQHNAISGQSAQFFVDNEALYPNNVIRDPTTGLITEVDTENVNLFAYKEDRWDLSLSYRRPTSWGTLGLFAMETINEHEQQQVSFSTPRSEFVGTDGGPLKTKFNGTLSWSLRGLTLSCTGTYYDKYAATTRAINTLTPSQITSILNAQGAFYVQSQTYYDLFASYTIPNVRFGSSRLLARLSAYALSNMTIQLGVHNVFNTFPAYDSNNGPFYYSYYGDIRLRNYWLTLKKAF